MPAQCPTPGPPPPHQQSFRLNTSLQPSGTNPINIKPVVIREISQSLHSRALLCLPTRPKLPLTRELCFFNLGTSYKAYVRDWGIKLIPCEPRPCRQSPTPSGPHGLCQEAAEGLHMEDGCGAGRREPRGSCQGLRPPQGTHIVFVDHVASGSDVTALQS